VDGECATPEKDQRRGSRRLRQDSLNRKTATEVAILGENNKTISEEKHPLQEETLQGGRGPNF